MVISMNNIMKFYSIKYSQILFHELHKANNRCAKLDGEILQGFNPTQRTTNKKGLQSGKNSLPQGRTWQLVI